MKDKLLGFISGAAYGVATAVPGVSGGTLLIICGVYDRVCEALALNIERIKKDAFFFALFAAGLAAGVFGFANLITFLIDKIPLITYIALAVFIAAGIPSVYKKATADGKFTKAHIIPAFIGFTVVTALFLAEILEAQGAKGSTHPVMLVIFGAFAGIASIIPGVSGSFVLVILGAYEEVIGAVKNFTTEYITIAFVGIGAVIGLVGGSRLITYLLKKAGLAVYATILGMLIASVIMMTANAIVKYAI